MANPPHLPSGDFRVRFTDGEGAIEASGRLTSAKSVERLIRAPEAGKTLFDMIAADEDKHDDEAASQGGLPPGKHPIGLRQQRPRFSDRLFSADNALIYFATRLRYPIGNLLRKLRVIEVEF